MSLVYGWYSFKIKSYKAEDLNLEEEQWKNADFEVRQEVFHLFWLPLWTTVKLYGLRKNGELLALPRPIITQLRTKKVKTPWYSYFIPIALVIGLLGFAAYVAVGTAIMRSQSDSLDKNRYDVATNDVQEKLSNLLPNSYLRIIDINKVNRGAALYLKVIGNEGDLYHLQAFEAKIPYRSTEKYYWKTSEFDTLSVTESELKNAVCLDYSFYKEKNCGFEFFGDGKKYIVDQIEYFDEPVIDGDIDWDFWKTIRIRKFYYYNTRYSGDRDNLSWFFKLKFQNFGVPVNLVEIKNVDNEINWLDSLPVSFDRYEYLKEVYIEGSTITKPDDLNFKSQFIFEDSLKTRYEFMINGNDNSYTINRMKE